MSVNILQRLDALDKNIKITFKKQRDNITDDLKGVVYDETPTNLPIDTIVSLDGFGLMHEFKSERKPGVIGSLVTVVRSKKWERTIDVKKEDIEDDNIGMIPALVNTVAIASKRTPTYEVMQALLQGFTTKLSDNKPFFDTSRGNLQTGALTADNLNAAQVKLSTQLDSEGAPLGFMATTLVVGPRNKAAAEQLINAQQINGTSNTLYHTLKLIVSPYITDESWYVVDTNQGVFPLTLVMRVRPDTIVSKTDLNSDRAFDKDIFSWGTRGRFAAAYHNPKLIVGSVGE